MSLATDEFSTPGIFAMLVIGGIIYLGVAGIEWYGQLIVDLFNKIDVDVYTLPGIRELTEYFNTMGRSHLP